MWDWLKQGSLIFKVAPTVHHGFNQVANIFRNLVALLTNMIIQYINELTILVLVLYWIKYIWLWEGNPVMKEFYLKSLKASCCSLYMWKRSWRMFLWNHLVNWNWAAGRSFSTKVLSQLSQLSQSVTSCTLSSTPQKMSHYKVAHTVAWRFMIYNSALDW